MFKNSRSGLSLIEAVVALAILGIAAYMISDLFLRPREDIKSSTILAAMLDVDHAVNAALTVRESYQEQIDNNQLGSNVDPSFPSLDLKYLDGTIVAKYNEADPNSALRYFNPKDLSDPCSSGPSVPCVIQVELDFNHDDFATGDSNTLARHYIAYRIGVANNYRNLYPDVRPIGANYKVDGSGNYVNTFDPGDYVLTIPEEYYTYESSNKTECLNSNDDWYVWGFINKYPSSVVICDGFDSGPECSDDEFPVGLRLRYNNGWRWHIRCRPFKKIVCDDEGYVLSQLNPRELDSRVGSVSSRSRCVVQSSSLFPKNLTCNSSASGINYNEVGPNCDLTSPEPLNAIRSDP